MILGDPRTGRSLELRGNDPLLLAGRDSAWLVESGAAAVFAVRVEAGRATGQRLYLFTASAGEILLGTALGGRALLAVPVESTMLVPLQVERFENALPTYLVSLGQLAPMRQHSSTAE